MKVVLLERVVKLGQMGDIVEVKAGYARNYLLPSKKGLRATDENIKFFEGKKAELEAKNLESTKEAEKAKKQLNGKHFIIIRSASDTGALYGSVSSKDLCKILSEEGVKIAKNQIILEKPIKDLGIYELSISLHPEVTAEVLINVARTPEEAKLQESGATVKEIKSDENKETQVEIEKLFDDVEENERLKKTDSADQISSGIELETPHKI